MSIIKHKIKYNKEDIQINFSLETGVDFLGYQQEIESIKEEKINQLINPPVDAEVRRFKNNNTTDFNLNFYFYNAGYYLSFTAIGFTENELRILSPNVANSFFILDFYDDTDTTTQTRLFSTYLTKITTQIITPQYTLNPQNQYYYLNIPINYIEEQEDDIVDVYGMLSFYDAKNGKIRLFYNNNLSPTPTTFEKMYWKTEINLLNHTWKFKDISSPLLAYEEYVNQKYIDKINETVSNFDVEKQIYPTGNTFNPNTGKYYFTI